MCMINDFLNSLPKKIHKKYNNELSNDFQQQSTRFLNYDVQIYNKRIKFQIIKRKKKYIKNSEKNQRIGSLKQEKLLYSNNKAK